MYLQAKYQEKRFSKGFGIIFVGPEPACDESIGEETKLKDDNLELEVTLDIQTKNKPKYGKQS